MGIREMDVKIQGVSPLLMNRDDLKMWDPEKYSKQRGEEYLEMEERVWRDKAHFEAFSKEDNPKVVVRDIWIKKCLIASQKQSGCPILPPGSKKRTDTLRNYFVSGVLINDSVVYDKNKKIVTKKDLQPFKAMVRPQKTGGKVCCIRPMIETGWNCKVHILIADAAIKENDIIQCLTWAGTYNGIGDWRVERGGQFGRFTVVS